jgi:TolA-binding protein
MFRRFSVLVVLGALALPSYAPAADKSIQELQRDVALLQQMVKELQQAQDKRFADLLPIVQQAADSAARANTAIAGIQTVLQQNLRTQEEKVVTPVVGLSTRMDNMTSELKNTEQNITDLASQLSKILAMLDDMNRAIKVIQTPPAPPPVDNGSATNPGGSTSVTPGNGQVAPPGPPPGSSKDMYDNALHDYTSGNPDFALQEFGDYLKYFDNTPLAPNAQYYIGMIHYGKGDYEQAAKDFDMVVEKYDESANKISDSRYYKGMSLLKSGKRMEAAQEFRDLITRHPRDPLATQACTRLKELTLPCPVPAANTRKNVKKE